MDIRETTRLRSARSPSSYRFLGESLHQNPSPDSSTVGDELTEDDIFDTGDVSEHNLHSEASTPSSSSSSTPSRPQNRQSRPGFGPSESFGILAALPENETHSVFNHKASVPTSLSRGIPLIPKPTQDRIPSGNSPYSAIKYHQSAPLNVPMLPKMSTRRIDLEHDGDDEDKGSDDEGVPMVPPHEIVARSLAKSQILACSVLEGAGRTLKGRDLRQVRNAVFRQTGAGIQVLVKCDKPEKLWTAMTEADGSFEVAAEISTSQSPPFECVAKILGGPHPMYASGQTMVYELVKKSHSDYSTSTPLVIYSRCPKSSCSSEDAVGSSKTVSLPLPIEWGLAPSSYYFPFIPIIGIP